MKNKARLWIILGAALLGSALLMALIAGAVTSPEAALALRISAGADAVLGLVFLFLGLRASGGSPE